jgi:hypothetical protein
MRISCWMCKATNTHTGYIILIAFPLHQWLHQASHYVIRLLLVFLTFRSNNVEGKTEVLVQKNSQFHFIRHEIPIDCLRNELEHPQTENLEWLRERIVNFSLFFNFL